MSQPVSGQTLSEVQKLNEGDAYVVHSGVMSNYVRQMIGDLRGWPFLKTIKIFIVSGWSDCDRLMGYRGVIRIDHAVLEPRRMGPEVVARVLDIAAGCNVRHEDFIP